MLSFKSSLCISGNGPLSVLSFANIFIQSVACFLLFLILSSQFLILTKSRFSIIPFMDYAFGDVPKGAALVAQQWRIWVWFLGADDPLKSAWQLTPVFLPEDSLDRTWWVTGHGITKSQTELSNWRFHFQRQSKLLCLESTNSLASNLMTPPKRKKLLEMNAKLISENAFKKRPQDTLHIATL